MPDLRRVPALALLLAAAACHRQARFASVATPVPVTLEQSVAELRPQEIAALAPRVARIAVMPDSVSIAPGETYSYGALRVIAIDSSGSALGRLGVYDVSLTPGAAALVGARQLRGVVPGESDMWIRFPQALWSGGGSSLAAIRVRIVVRSGAAAADHPPAQER